MSTEVVEQLIQAINTHDGATVAKRYTETATILGQSDEPLRGGKEIAENYDAYFRTYPDFSLELKSSRRPGSFWLVKE